MLYEDPVYISKPGGVRGGGREVDRLALQPQGAAMAVGPATLLTVQERPVAGHGGGIFQEGHMRGSGLGPNGAASWAAVVGSHA